MEPGKSLEPHDIAKVRRRLGFVALLWWIAAGFGTAGLMHGMAANWGRYLLVGLSWLLACFFTYAWWQVHKGLPAE
jgi:hypothetical protein